MNNLFFSFITTSLAGFSTLLGILAIFFNKKGREKLISCSLIFSSGIMLFIYIFDLIPSSISYLNSIYQFIPSLIIGLVFIIFGFLLTHTINNFLNEEKNTLYKVGIISMIALIIHNIPEGCSCYASQINWEYNIGYYMLKCS